MAITNIRVAKLEALEIEQADFVEIIRDLEEAKDDVADKYNDLVQMWEDSWSWWRRNVTGHGDYDEEREAIKGIWDKIEQTTFPAADKVSGSILELTQRVIDRHFQ